MNSDQSPQPVSKLLNLSGHRALVTGASGNIGRGIALRLAEAFDAWVSAAADDIDAANAQLAAALHPKSIVIAAESD